MYCLVCLILKRYRKVEDTEYLQPNLLDLFGAALNIAERIDECTAQLKQSYGTSWNAEWIRHCTRSTV